MKSNKVKQISYLSAIVILVSGTIGSGIFFKSQGLFELGHGSLSYILGIWILAGCGMLALGVGIAEMALKTSGRKGVLEWTQKFMPKTLHLSSKNFIQMLFIPMILFALPIYEVKALNQIGLHLTGWEEWAVGLFIFMWFAIMTYVSLKATEKFQWITMFIKFIPLMALPIMALIHVGDSPIGSAVSPTTKGLTGVGGGAMILIAGIPAVMFSFDGFYSVSTMREEMKNPKKLGSVIAIGLAIITVIYLFVSLSFAGGSPDGTYMGITMSSGVKKMFSTFVAIGILGVVNGYAQFGTKTYIALAESDHSWYSAWFTKTWSKLFKRNISKKLGAWLSMMFIVLTLFVVLGVVGIYVWPGAVPTRASDDYLWYQSTSNLIGFTNIVTNYKSLLIFTVIGLSLSFAIKGMLKDKSRKGRIRSIAAIFGVIFVFSAGAFQLVEAIVDMTGFNNADQMQAVVKFCFLISFIGLSGLMGIIEAKKTKRS